MLLPPHENSPSINASEAKLALFDGPHYPVFGNHDTDQVSKEDFMSVVRSTGVSPDATYYSFDTRGVHFIILDTRFKENGASYSGIPGEPGSGYTWNAANIPAEELKWLATDIAATKSPVIVLTHQKSYAFSNVLY